MTPGEEESGTRRLAHAQGMVLHSLLYMQPHKIGRVIRRGVRMMGSRGVGGCKHDRNILCIHMKFSKNTILNIT